MTLEKTTLRLGYIPLTDCLPLVVAQEQGFFAAHGLTVELCCEASWANIRDKLIVGHLDGAQVLAPMLLAASLGLGGLRKPMLTAFSLGLNGNGITVSNRLFAELRQHSVSDSALDAAQALATVVHSRTANDQDPLVIATVFPFSSHNYLLRYWLSAAGIDPTRDIKLVALPPQQMVDNLRLEHIDAFCVGEPWNSCAVAMGLGRCLVTGYEIWQNGPEKVFGVTEQWHEENPNTHAAVLRALDQAAAWIENNLSAALQLLDRGHYVEVPLEWLAQPLTGDLRVGLAQNRRDAESFHVFHRYMANFPWRSQAQWFLQQMQRWRQIPADTDIAAVAARVYRADFYRDVFESTRSLPLLDMKPEGEHESAWTMAGTKGDVTIGPDRFIGGAIFQPLQSDS
ncbi:MAG: nitrate-binding protein NasS [Verrucomicrobiaceae bacterium]|nr:nitrate-binding protein NasS [Verrucomicrobiaceae bacterium]